MTTDVKLRLSLAGTAQVVTQADQAADAIEGIGASAAGASQQGAKLATTLDQLDSAASDLIQPTGRLQDALHGVGAAAATTASATASAAGSARQAASSATAATTSSGRLQDALQGVAKASGAVGQAGQAAQGALGAVSGASTAAAINTGRLGDALRDASAASAALSAATPGAQQSMAGVSAASVAAVSGTGRLQQGLRGVGTAAEAGSKQAANAMRMLPMQLGDVASQIASGGNPLVALFQQGLQVKDSFGGLRPMFLGLASAITPVGAAVTGLGLGVGFLAAAYVSGLRDQREFLDGLALTGNAAGVTRASVAAMAERIAASGKVTIGTAREISQAAATSGQFTEATVESGARAMAALGKLNGKTAAENLAAFKGMEDGVANWAAKSNETHRFLTAAQFEQIRSLEEQGRTAEAARLALDSLSATLESRTAPALNLVERALQTAKAEWSRFWNAAKDLDGADDVEAKLGRLRGQIAELKKAGQTGYKLFGPSLADLEQQEQQILKEQALTQIRASDQAAAQKAEAETIKRRQAAAALQDRLSGGNAAFQRDLKLLHDTYAAGEMGVEAYRQRVAKLIETQGGGAAAVSRAREAEQRAIAIQNASLALQAVQARNAADATLRVFDEQQQRLAALRAAGLIGQREAAQEATQIERDRLAAQVRAVEQQIALEQRRATPRGDQAAVLNKAAAVAQLEGQRAQLQARAAAIPVMLPLKLAEIDLATAREAAARWGQLMEQAQVATAKATEAAAKDAAAMIVDPMERARVQAEQAVTELIQGSLTLRTELGNTADVLRGRAQAAIEAGDTAAGASLQAQAAALDRQLAAYQASLGAQVAAIRAKPDAEVLKGYLEGSNPGQQIADGFDRASQSLAAFVTAFQGLTKQQADYDAARRAAGADTAKLAAVELKAQQNQISSYATLAGSAKGFFKEGSKGYKALEAAEKAFRAVQLGMAIKNAVEQLGLIAAVTTAKVAGDQTAAASSVAAAATDSAASMAAGAASAAAGVANQAKGDPYSAFARMAAMAAAMAALGFAVGGSRGGGPGPTNTGTGTVLGDPSATSKSLANSIDALREVDTLTMRYSAQMLASLRTIESSIGGVASLLVRGGGLQASAAGVAEGFNPTGVGSLLSKVPLIGNLLGGLFGTKTTIVGQGIQAADQSLSGILADGFDASFYTDVNKKKKAFGVTYSNKTRTQLTDADPELERQFSLIFSSFVDTVKAAAPAVGVALGDVEGRLADFTVSLGRIDLKGLTGDQIQEKLAAVFGAAGDRIAQAALPGLDDFQRVGEGYLETVARVAVGVETAGAALDRFGLTAISLADVVNKQGDVGAELLRQAILGREAVGGLADLVSTFDGGVSELADTYAALLDVRSGLRQIGQDGNAVSADLLRGAGGLQAMQDALGAYSETFLTDSERLANAAASLGERFGSLGLAMPASAGEFRALVEGIDTSTAAGQRLLGAVLGLADGFSVLVERERAIADERSGLERQILEAQGDTAAIRALERAALDESNRSLFDRLMALQDGAKTEAAAAQQATTVAQQREQIERQLLQLQGDTAELRRRELAALDPQNRALQQQLYAAQDAKAAAEEAAKARDAWRQLGATLADEVKRILGLTSERGQGLAASRADFAIKTAAARAGDQTAAKELAVASRTMLEQAEASVGTAQELAALRAATAASLSETMRLIADRGAEVPQVAAGGQQVGAPSIVGGRAPEPQAAGTARIWTAEQTAAMLAGGQEGGERQREVGIERLIARVEALTREVEGLRHEARATASHTARIAKSQDDWTYAGLLVRTDQDQPLHTQEVTP